MEEAARTPALGPKILLPVPAERRRPQSGRIEGARRARRARWQGAASGTLPPSDQRPTIPPRVCQLRYHRYRMLGPEYSATRTPRPRTERSHRTRRYVRNVGGAETVKGGSAATDDRSIASSCVLEVHLVPTLADPEAGRGCGGCQPPRDPCRAGNAEPRRLSFGADGDDGKVLPVARSFIKQEPTAAGRGQRFHPDSAHSDRGVRE
jgi:hypothetical protein